MGYNITISPLAQQELAEAYSYYAEIAIPVLKKFDREIVAAFSALEKNPFFKLRYKNVRALPIKNFPFLIFFTLNEPNTAVEIRSIFNTHQDPTKYR